ncbi:hypothetical protein CVT25_014159 [Psilocybe cyanescens]|uniref:Dihydroxyacetone kinase n=1 Tax=Psilocybe cyanescens TaxID=93625 RepID=A0A409XUM1_PSICY|nr:hypothetical protein CVT25_014159 [Psilocybe cyanescens]
MNTKHLYDSADGLVLKSLRGAVALNPGVLLHEPSKTVYINPSLSSPKHTHNHKRRQVAVISGGGSGHEPAHAGYTGRGMLSAAVAGEVFASPSARQILKALELASRASASAGTCPGKGTREGEGEREGAEDNTEEGASTLDVLAIINNYTGDILNFGLAIEKARAALPGVRIARVVVADDVSLLPQNRHTNTGTSTTTNAPTKLVGPRGLAANILVCKLLGALAESGASLDVVHALGNAVVRNLRSVGVGLEHCHVPGREREREQGVLGARECEVGLGLHNEPGVRRREIGAPGELVGEMVGMLLRAGAGAWAEEDERRLVDDCRAGVVLFINNLGGMSQLEMGAVVDDALRQFAVHGIRPKRVYCAAYMTSLNAPGFSISILNITGTMRAFRATVGREVGVGTDISIEDLLDAPTDAYAWVGARTNWSAQEESPTEDAAATLSRATNSDDGVQGAVPSDTGPIPPADQRNRNTAVHGAIRAACRRVIDVHAQLTEFDTIVGDGDCGDTFKAGASAIMNALDNGPLAGQTDIAAVVYGIAEILEDAMGGTIGALLAIFFHALAVSLSTNRTVGGQLLVGHGGAEELVPWGKALQDAKNTLSRYTPAEVGDRTIIDALGPFCTYMAQTKTQSTHVGPGPGDGNEYENKTERKEGQPGNERSLAIFAEAVRQARMGAERTRGMTAHLGRAAYVGVGSSSSTSAAASALDLPPDPGAWGICAVLEGLLDGIKSELRG